MKRLTTLIKKNFTLILRSKSSALIIILGPLLLIMLVGAAFNTANIYGIRVGVYAESYSPLAEALIHELNENKYATQKTETLLACTEGVKSGVFHVCALFPKDLKVGEGGNIEFYVDNSKTNLVYLVSETIAKQIGEKTKQLSTQLTKTVVDTLEDIENEIKDKEQLINTVKERNEEAANLLGVVSDDLVQMNFAYQINDFPFTSIKSHLPSNNSASQAAFDKMKRVTESAISDMQTAGSTRKRSVDRINRLALDADASRLSIQKIQSTFKTIKDDITTVKETGVGNIVNPLKAEIKPIAAEKTYLNFIFPTLLVMVIMFVSLLLASTLEIREKVSKVYFKNFITPTSNTAFVVANYVTNMLILALQLGVLVGASYFFFKEGLIANLPLLGLALFLITSLFVFIGIIFGNIFKSEETNAIATISLGFIFLFFSSALIPIEALPTIIKNIAAYNPFFISESLLNKIMLFQASLPAVGKQFILLTAYLIGAILVTGIVKKTTERRK